MNTSVEQKTEAVTMSDWSSGSSLEVLALRANLLARIRAYFVDHPALEVDTPVVSRFTSPDCMIEPLKTSYTGPGHAEGLPLYLNTSPELFMKRLLAEGIGSIYQLSHVYRDGEAGSRHNPEFMLLEWYRPDFDHFQLMDEIDDLLIWVLDGYLDYQPATRTSYRDWFKRHTDLDPGLDEVSLFSAFARSHLSSVPASMDEYDLDPWLDLLITHWIEPRIQEECLFVYDYPANQASLACIREESIPVAERFELYLYGMEIANGFHELRDPQEQLRRFTDENHKRKKMGLNALPIDPNFLAAMEAGLPDCSGVALGFDRLVMLAAGVSDIAQVLPFSFERV